MFANIARRLIRRVADASGSVSERTVGLPVPVSLTQEEIELKRITLNGGTERFNNAEYLEINKARLAHLSSLGLPLEEKRVLDVGCGVGHLSQFFVDRKCKVVCIDGRSENIAALQSRYPGLEAHVANVEVDPLSKFGIFDIVFSYGLLYHLENPIAGLCNMASVCREMLLLETMICDHELPVLRIEHEPLAFTQTLGHLGSRPSPSFLVLALHRAGFSYIYTVREPPSHSDFQFEWQNNHDWQRNGHPLRCVFVASRFSLENPSVVSLLKAH